MTHDDRVAPSLDPRDRELDRRAALDRDRDRRDGLADDGPDSMIRREEELRVRTERVATGAVRLRKRVVTEEKTFTVTVRREVLEVIEEGDVVLTGDREARPATDRPGGLDIEQADAAAANVPAPVSTVAADQTAHPAALDAVEEARREGAAGVDPRAELRDGAETDVDPDSAEIILYEEQPVVALRTVAVERVRLQRVAETEQRTITDSVKKERVEVIDETDRDAVRRDDTRR